MFEEARNIGLGNGVKIAGQEFTVGSEKIGCNDSKAYRKVRRRRKRWSSNKNESCEGYDKENLSGRMDANNSWWVNELLAADCEKA